MSDAFAVGSSFIAGLFCGGLGYHSSNVLSYELRLRSAGNRIDTPLRMANRIGGAGAYIIALQIGLVKAHNVPGFDAGLIPTIVLPDTLLLAGDAFAGAAHRERVNFPELFKAARHRLVCQCVLMGPIMLYQHRQTKFNADQ